MPCTSGAPHTTASTSHNRDFNRFHIGTRPSASFLTLPAQTTSPGPLSVVSVIFARPEVTGATDVVAVLRAPGSVGRAVARVSIVRTTMAALDSQIAANLRPGDVADEAAPDEANGTSDDSPCDGPHGRVCDPFLRGGGRGRGDDCGSHQGKSTKRFHVFVPAGLPTRKLNRRLRRIWDASTQAE
jgi:hypothetical protein